MENYAVLKLAKEQLHVTELNLLLENYLNNGYKTQNGCDDIAKYIEQGDAATALYSGLSQGQKQAVAAYNEFYSQYISYCNMRDNAERAARVYREAFSRAFNLPETAIITLYCILQRQDTTDYFSFTAVYEDDRAVLHTVYMNGLISLSATPDMLLTESAKTSIFAHSPAPGYDGVSLYNLIFA